MIIYRVEKPDDHFGPYRSSISDYNQSVLNAILDAKHSWSDSHPVGYLTCQWGQFALNSIESMQNWFAGFGPLLDAAGYVIAVFDVPELAIGKCGFDSYGQVTFTRDDYKPITTYLPTDILGTEGYDYNESEFWKGYIESSDAEIAAMEQSIFDL